MLSWFPTPYPDELWYSVLCRYYMYSGYSSKVDAMMALGPYGRTLLSAHFALRLDEFCFSLPENWLTPQQIIEHHTLYSYYSRFLPLERKILVMDAMRGINNMQPATVVGARRKQMAMQNWRYCPLCAQNDMEKYGETYWHRLHQIPDLRICPIHKVYLSKTQKAVQSNLEMVVPLFPIESPIKQPISQEEIEVSQLIADLLMAPCDMELHSAPYLLDEPLVKNGFRSVTGKQTDITALIDALQKKLYVPTDLGQGPIPNNCSKNNIVEVFKKNRTPIISLVIHLAWLLGMNTQDLLAPSTEVTVTERWEQEISILFKQGWTKGELVNKYAVSEETVENTLIGLGLYTRKSCVRPALEKQKDIRRTACRNEILKAIQETGMTRQKIKNRKSPYFRSYYWLMKNDRDWIVQVINKLPDVRVPSSCKINWEEKDEETYPKIVDFFAKNPPKPVYLITICVETGIRREWLKHMPRCREYIEANKR